MARLKNPENREDAIRQDYKDKHSECGSVLVCRKYPRQVKSKKNGNPVFDKDGNPVMYKAWYEVKQPITNEDMYVHSSRLHSEHHQNDCYCTLNCFPSDYAPLEKEDGTKTKYRDAEKLLYLTGFYLDFDHKAVHELARSAVVPPEVVEEVYSYKEQIIEKLESFFETDYGMPVITVTGGGYGFYIKIKPLEVTYENVVAYKSVWELLFRKYNELLSDLLDKFENDHSVIGDLVRVIRITGTYNSKSDTYAEYVCRYGYEETNEIYEYSLEELISLYHLDIEAYEEEKKVTHRSLQERKEEKKEEKKKEKSGNGSKNTSSKDKKHDCINNSSEQKPELIQKDNIIIYPNRWYKYFVCDKQLGGYLERSIQSFNYLNENDSIKRNCALFLIACFMVEIEYAKYDSETLNEVISSINESIASDIMDFNSKLSHPLDERDIEYILNSAFKNKYHFRKLETIQKYLFLTDEEFERIGWLDNQKKEQQKKDNNNALTELDKKAIELYLSGLSDEKIGKELGISKRTSIRIRERLGVKDRTIKYEDIDFEGNKRHLKHKTNEQSKNMTAIKRKDVPFVPKMNEGQQKSHDLILSRENVFLTGDGGAGKSFVVKKSKDSLEEQGKVVAVCASTASAAHLHEGGKTFHSFFGFDKDYECFLTKEGYQKLSEIDTVFIDEVSMLGKKAFDALYELKQSMTAYQMKFPQLVVIGDVLQLPPVDDEFCFKSEGFKAFGFKPAYLTENVRQQDDADFSTALNLARRGQMLAVVTRVMNHVCSHEEDTNLIYLMANNKGVDRINNMKLQTLPGEFITMGDFSFKIGAKVIFTKNGRNNNKYFNNLRGVITGVKGDAIIVLDEYGEEHEVRECTFEKDGIKVRSYPLALGYAITIHKAQGMTLDGFNLDPSCFAEGQLYTALSRAKEGCNVHLLKPIKPEYFKTSKAARMFDNYLRVNASKTIAA